MLLLGDPYTAPVCAATSLPAPDTAGSMSTLSWRPLGPLLSLLVPSSPQADAEDKMPSQLPQADDHGWGTRRSRQGPEEPHTHQAVRAPALWGPTQVPTQVLVQRRWGHHDFSKHI